jgi:hypothetical protein
MTKRLLVLLLFVVFFAVPTQPQQEVHFPKDGNGLLEFCGLSLAYMDSPGTILQTSDTHGIQMMKQGWCAGHLQTMREMISFWQVQVAKTVAMLNGEQNPSVDEIKQMTAKTSDFTCIPNEVNQGQLLRVLVKWLRDHPERLHEPDFLLSMDAFHDSFPCHTDASNAPTKK